MIPAAGSPSFTIRARHVLPLAGPPIENGWISVRRGRVVSIGRRAPAGKVCDLGDVIVVPGLVNAHTHLEFSDLDVPLDGTGGLPQWIERVVQLRRSRPVEANSASRVEASIRRGLRESAAAGVTTIGEIATSVVPAAYRHDGPRLRVYRECLGLSPDAITAALDGLDRDLDRLSSGGIPAGVSPHAPYSVAAALGRTVLDRARQRRLPAAMHLGESAAEAELLSAGTGAFRTLLNDLGAWPTGSPPTLLSAADWISRLARGPRGLVVHGTFLGTMPDDVSLARLVRHRDRLCVAVCPRTTRLLSGSLPPVARFRDAGVRLAIGTDSRASNPDLSVLAECRALVDAGLCSPVEALRMATVDGAWALMLEKRCGILAPGRAADMAILRPGVPVRDPYAAALDLGTQVVTTLRAGRVIAGAEIGEG